MAVAVTKKVLDAAYLVISSCGSRTTVSSQHLLLLARLSTVLCEPQGKRKHVTTATHRGGKAVLPSEYFGHDSGNYALEVPVGHRPWSTDMTRTSLPISNRAFTDGVLAGGGYGNDHDDKQMSDALIDALVKAYNKNRTHSVRVGKDARSLLKALIKHNMVAFLKAGNTRGSSRLTKNVAKTAYDNLAHARIQYAPIIG